MAKAKSAVTQPSANKHVVAKPRVTEAAAYHARGIVDTEGHGLIGNVVRGWETYSDPTLVQRRKVAHERRKVELVAYFSDKLAS